MLCKAAPSTLGTRWKSGLQHCLLLPEPPAGARAAGAVPIHAEDVSTGFMPVQVSAQGCAPPPLKTWMFLEHCAVAQQKRSVLMKI